MKKIICMIGVLLITGSAFAQKGSRAAEADQQHRRVEENRGTEQGRRPGQGMRRAERVHAIKVGYLTDKLQLSSSQATAFWPVYNEYERELREARKAFRQKYRAGAGETNAQAAKYIEDNLDQQEKVIDIKRKYKDRFLKVISAHQLAGMYEAERDFKKLLIQQLRERRGNRPDRR